MNIRKILCAALLMLVLLCASALAAVPSPTDEFYFLDGANVLTEATEGEIFFSNQLLEKACGAQIVVVTTNSTQSTSIDDYAYELFNSWQIGDADKLNGFLLVLAIEDDDYYAVCGADLQSKFTSGTLKQYFDQYLEDDFAAKNYDAGTKKFFEAVFKRVSDTYSAKVTTQQGIAAYQAWLAKADAEPMAASGGGGSYRETGSRGGYQSQDSGGGMMLIVVFLLLIILVVVLSRRSRYNRTYSGRAPTVLFFGRPWGHRAPPPPRNPGPMNVPRPGAGGVRGTPGGTRPPQQRSTYTGPGLGDFLRGSGFSGGGRSSGGSRSSGAGRSFGGSRSFGSSRGGGGFTRGGGAGRGRH